MSYQKQLEKMGATPGKLALIGGLVLVLVVVIVQQIPSGDAGIQASANVSTELVAGTSQSQPQQVGKASPNDENLAGASTTEQQFELPPWPEINLAETLASDPFALPNWVAKEEREIEVATQKPDRLAELQKQGASVVVIAAGQKSASIGEQKIRVGDIVAGYKVSDITTQGIFVDKLDAR